jgi:hypothetical protein
LMRRGLLAKLARTRGDSIVSEEWGGFDAGEPGLEKICGARWRVWIRETWCEMILGFVWGMMRHMSSAVL